MIYALALVPMMPRLRKIIAGLLVAMLLGAGVSYDVVLCFGDDGLAKLGAGVNGVHGVKALSRRAGEPGEKISPSGSRHPGLCNDLVSTWKGMVPPRQGRAPNALAGIACGLVQRAVTTAQPLPAAAPALLPLFGSRPTTVLLI